MGAKLERAAEGRWRVVGAFGEAAFSVSEEKRHKHAKISTIGLHSRLVDADEE
jgi:hypothetical protein